MIALLAAVPQETRLLRDAMDHATAEIAYGLTFSRGSIAGVNVCLAHSGVGKAAAAAAATSLLHHSKADTLLLFGCGGAYPNSGLEIGDLAVAEKEIFADEGVLTISGFEDLETMGLPMRQTEEALYNEWPTDPGMTDWIRSQHKDIKAGPFVTVSTCTGTTSKALEIEKRTKGICENMEGAAVVLACHQLSTPMMEVRGISNMVEDRNTSQWDIPLATSAVQEMLIDLFKTWPER